MNLITKIKKYAKKREKIEVKLNHLNEIYNSLTIEVNKLSTKIEHYTDEDLEKKNAEILVDCMLLDKAREKLEKVEKKRDKNIFQYNLIDKYLDDLHQRIELENEF